MRRGLLAWSEQETPKAALEARVSRMQAAMKAQGVDALLAYTHFPRPAAVSYLTHFIPYWNQGLMVMGQTGLPSIVVALSNRVRGWALETCHVDDVVCSPQIGASAAKVVQGYGGTIKKIGVVDVDRLPNGLANPFRAAFGGIELADATDLFTQARSPADGPEIALTRRAAAIADDAIDAARTGGFDRASALIGAVDGAARDNAAEEVAIAIVPDLSLDTDFRRIEGDAVLGLRYAIRATVAYKGFWIRRTASLARDDAAPDSWADAAARLRTVAEDLGTGANLAKTMNAAFKHWSAVGPLGGHPLADLADDKGLARTISAGSIVSLSVRLDTPDGPWLGGGPILLADEAGKSAEVLFA
jgi:hypothetical protein